MLYEEIITKEGLCSGCGACVLICPFNKLSYNYKVSLPEQVGEEKSKCPISEQGKCGLCVEVCPRLNREVNESLLTSPVELPEEIYISQSKDEKTQEASQSGGVVTELLRNSLKSGIVDAILAYGRDEKWRVYSKIIKDETQLCNVAGSKYSYTPLIDGLKKMYENFKGTGMQFAIVGLPCHLEGIAHLKRLNSKYTKNLRISIGLFCTQSFSYEKLIKSKFKNEMNIPLESIRKMIVSRGEFILVLDNKELIKFPLKEIKERGHAGCFGCIDFSSELADISCGNLGSQHNTIVVCRTATGNTLYNSTLKADSIKVVDDALIENDLESIRKLSIFKRKRAINTVTKIKQKTLI